MVKGSGTYHKPDKAALAEWNTSYEIVKLLLVSLARCHSQAVKSAKVLCQPLNQETVVDGKYGYRHGQLVRAHLDLLQLLLKEADLYLPKARCEEMWDTLVTNIDSCEADREVIFYCYFFQNDVEFLPTFHSFSTFCIDSVLLRMVCFLLGRYAAGYTKCSFS